jgi:hypothetical protein
MANFVTVRVGGVWAGNSALLSTEMEEIDSRWPKLINAADGSTHAPTAPIILGGAGLNVTGLLDVDGDLEQDAASLFEMHGEVSMEDGSLLRMKVNSSHVFQLGSLLQISSGAELNIFGDATWQNNKWPLVTSRNVHRCAWRLASVTYSGTAPESPRAWLETGLDGPSIKTSDETTARFFFVELLELPDSGTINSVTITTQGVAGNSSLTLPEYTLYRWGKGETPVPLGDVEDAHDPASWSAEVDTVLTPDAPVTIDKQYHYGVQVRAPYHASVAASMRILDFQSSIAIEQIRG